jgi:hypothetical protein
LIAGQYYKLLINWGENSGGALIKFWYSYSGQSQTIIPASRYYYIESVGSSPYTITVSCPAGYSGTASSTACVTVCGDGLRAGTEE